MPRSHCGDSGERFATLSTESRYTGVWNETYPYYKDPIQGEDQV